MKLGFIGAGNMGSAIISGILNKGALPADCIYVSRKHPEKGAELAQKGVHIMKDNLSLVQAVDCVLLAVKPVYAADVIREVYDALNGKFVISIVAGWTYEMLKDALPDAVRFVRVMPNTPLAVGEGMSLISSLFTCTDEEFDFAKSVFAAAGKVAVVEDHVYTPANGISGCGPAFVYAPPMRRCSSKPWRMAAFATACRAHWRMNWPRKRLSARRKWCLRQANIPAD